MHIVWAAMQALRPAAAADNPRAAGGLETAHTTLPEQASNILDARTSHMVSRVSRTTASCERQGRRRSIGVGERRTARPVRGRAKTNELFQPVPLKERIASAPPCTYPNPSSSLTRNTAHYWTRASPSRCMRTRQLICARAIVLLDQRQAASGRMRRRGWRPSVAVWSVYRRRRPAASVGTVHSGKCRVSACHRRLGPGRTSRDPG